MASELCVKKQRCVLKLRRKREKLVHVSGHVSVVIRVELHTVDEFLCFLDFRLALCFEPHEFELFGGKNEGKG